MPSSLPQPNCDERTDRHGLVGACRPLTEGVAKIRVMARGSGVGVILYSAIEQNKILSVYLLCGCSDGHTKPIADSKCAPGMIRVTEKERSCAKQTSRADVRFGRSSRSLKPRTISRVLWRTSRSWRFSVECSCKSRPCCTWKTPRQCPTGFTACEIEPSQPPQPFANASQSERSEWRLEPSQGHI